jgi:hypothetical protein
MTPRSASLFFICGSVLAVSAPAAAQTQADITPHILDYEGNPTIGIFLTTPEMYPACDFSDPQHCNIDVYLGCAPGGVSMKLLKFALETYNDGYADFAVNSNTVSPSSGAVFWLPWQNQNTDNPYLTNFATFALVNASTKALVYGVDQYNQSFPVTNTKQYFALSPDDPAPYRSGLTQRLVGGWEGLEYGYFDYYDDSTNACQYLRIDGVPDGDYDLVVEENEPRLMVCDPTTDTNCNLDGRVYDNATAVRVNLSTSNGVTTPTIIPTKVATRVTPIGPTVVGGPPAVVTHNVNTYDLFYVGTDGSLYRMNQGTNGVWQGGTLVYSSSNTVLDGPLAAVATNRSRTDVFAHTTSGQLLRVSSTDPSSWTDSSLYDGVLGAGGKPAAVASGPMSALVAWMTPTGSVACGLFDGTNWGTPATPLPLQTPAGVTFPSSQTPALTSSGDGMFHLFVHDDGGTVWYASYFGGVWTLWQSLPGGTVTGDLTAASPYLNCVDVFGKTADNRLLRNTWNGGDDGSASPAYAACGCGTPGHFCGWIDDMAGRYCIHGAVNCTEGNVGSSPTAISTGPQKLDVFYFDVTTPSILWGLHYDVNIAPSRDQYDNPIAEPWIERALGRVFVTTPTWPVPVAASWADNTFDVFQEFGTGQISVRSER